MTSLYSYCSVFSQAGAPSVFPPVTFPLGHGGHGRQQPQHPQLNVLEQDGEFKGRLSVDACPDLCLPATLGYESIWNRLHKNQQFITKRNEYCNLLKSALTLPSGHPLTHKMSPKRNDRQLALIGRSDTITAHTNSQN